MLKTKRAEGCGGVAVILTVSIGVFSNGRLIPPGVSVGLKETERLPDTGVAVGTTSLCTGGSVVSICIGKATSIKNPIHAGKLKRLQFPSRNAATTGKMKNCDKKSSPLFSL